MRRNNNKLKKYLIQAYDHRAFLYYVMGKYDKAQNDVKILKKYLQNKEMYYKTLSFQALMLCSLGKLDEGMKMYQEVYNYSIKNKKYDMLISAITSISLILSYKNKKQEALQFLNKGKVYLKKVDKEEKIAEYYNNLASIYHDDKQFDNALKYYKTALKYCKNFDSELLKSQVINNIAFLYEDIGDERAKEYYEKAIKYKKKLQYLEGIVISHINYGLFLMKIKKFKKADRNFKNLKYYLDKMSNCPLKIKGLFYYFKFNMIIGKFNRIKIEKKYIDSLLNFQLYSQIKKIFFYLFFISLKEKKINQYSNILLYIVNRIKNKNVKLLEILAEYLKILNYMEKKQINHALKKLTIIKKKNKEIFNNFLYGYLYYLLNNKQDSNNNFKLFLEQFNHKILDYNIALLIIYKMVKWKKIKTKIFKLFENEQLLTYYKL